MHAKTQILQHAEAYLGGRGTIKITDFRRRRGYFSATIILTTHTVIEYYEAYADGAAIAMVKIRTRQIQALPLFTSEESFTLSQDSHI